LSALLFRPGPLLAPEAHRVARALLEDAARDRGGRVTAAGDGAWRLEAAPPALDMARRALAAVLNGRDAALVGEAIATSAPIILPLSGEGPEAILATRPLAELLERRPILGFGLGGAPELVGIRLMPSAAAISAALGPRWAAAHWQEHARGIVARRALAETSAQAAPLHLDLPLDALPLPEGLAALPVLSPGALAHPPSIPFAVAGLGAEALVLLDPAHLPCATLYLRYHPALVVLPETLWRALGPARLVLEGVVDGAALEWGLSRGIGRFTGPHAERLLAARRRQGAAA
jgi:hypothetical protein